jgi:hypothetical protein
MDIIELSALITVTEDAVVIVTTDAAEILVVD